MQTVVRNYEENVKKVNKMIDKKIIKQVEDKFAIGITAISLLRESADNSVFLLKTDSKKLVLRISKRDLRSDVLFETTWLDYLRRKGLPVTVTKKTVNYKPFFLSNKLAIVLFELAPGQPLEIKPQKKPPLKKVANAAGELAKIHNVSYKININIPRKRDLLTEIERALNIKKKLAKFSEGGDTFAKELVFYQKWAKENKNDKYLIHNDYRPGNIFFRGDKVTAILDFDWSCPGPAIKDVAHSLAEWSFPDSAKKHWQSVFATFLESYNQRAKNKIKLDNNLYHWICFSCLSDAATYFADLADRNVFKKIASSYMYQKFLYFKKFVE